MADSNAQVWEGIFNSQSWGQYPESTLVRFLARNFKTTDNRSEINILELGCGPGVNLWLLTREGFGTHAIEFSQTAAEKATARLKKEGTVNLLRSLKIGDYFEKLDEFSDDYFDAVIDYESLYCNSLDKTQKILDKAAGKLKSGGKLFSVTFAHESWGFEVPEIEYHAVVASEGPLANKGYSRYSTKDDIQSLYNQGNFYITNLELVERHLANGKSIREWVVEAQKI